MSNAQKYARCYFLRHDDVMETWMGGCGVGVGDGEFYRASVDSLPEGQMM